MGKSKTFVIISTITFLVSAFLAISALMQGDTVVMGMSPTNKLLLTLGWLISAIWWAMGALYYKLGEK